MLEASVSSLPVSVWSVCGVGRVVKDTGSRSRNTTWRGRKIQREERGGERKGG